jgi:hypothetical protein
MTANEKLQEMTQSGSLGHLTRRRLLQLGGLGAFGLSLPELLRESDRGPRTLVRSCILFLLHGGPSQLDVWDMKPDAPAEIRGEFKPIATRAPGMMLTEVLPQLAQQADKFTLIRSIGVKPRGLANHGAAIYMLMTGHDPSNFSPTGLAVPPSREDLPSVGANVARHRPTEAGTLGYATVCGPVMEAGVEREGPLS